ncbi:hypothetical protein [Occallatibacter savannae]|uniref:hypothetical protein n=1 Tax=Occallatibacter savannae TaxID=1002691 RepID=UPI000D68F7DC|nr:hypothetical protein [Occallatibacter savannae]
MEEQEKAGSNRADILGFIGLAFAVLGLADVALSYRLVCLTAALICLPMSFHRQSAWPGWVRWALSLGAISFLAYVGWMTMRER